MDELSIKRLEKIERVAMFFEETVNSFCEKIGKPRWALLEGGLYPRYRTPSFTHFQVLMSVRIVSGFYASVCLLKNGYTQEAAIITRTIIEFTEKIFYAEEAQISAKLTEAQKAIQDSYFEDDVTCTEDLFKKDSWWIKMGSVHDSQEQYLNRLTAGNAPDNIGKIAKVIYHTFSRYVHGFYTSIMEMYEGETERFLMKGMLQTPREKEMIGGVFRSIVPVFSAFLSISQRLGMKESEKAITEEWRLFVDSPEYDSR